MKRDVLNNQPSHEARVDAVIRDDDQECLGATARGQAAIMLALAGGATALAIDDRAPRLGLHLATEARHSAAFDRTAANLEVHKPISGSECEGRRFGAKGV